MVVGVRVQGQLSYGTPGAIGVKGLAKKPNSYCVVEPPPQKNLPADTLHN